MDLSFSIVVDSTSSSAKVDSCSASAPPSVVTVTDSDVPEPAMAVLHTIASSGDDGAEASDDSSVTQEHVEQIDASSAELEILEAESVAAAAVVATADARLRFLRARRTSPSFHRRRPGRKFLISELQCDLYSFLTICLIVDRWRQFLSVLKFFVLQSRRTGPPSGVRISARRDGRTSDANRIGLAFSSSGGTFAVSSHLTSPRT